MIVHDKDTFRLFEFDKICARVATHCRCRSSRQRAEELKPLKDYNLLTLQLQQTAEYMHTLRSGYFPDAFFEDFEGEAELLKIPGSMLNESQFSRLRSASLTVNTIIRFMNERKIAFPFLIRLTQQIQLTNEIIEMIDEIIDMHGQMKNNASDELSRIRQQLFTSRREADRRFRSFIADLKKKGWLRENEENFYNNRRVLAVPSEYKKRDPRIDSWEERQR